MISRRMFNQSTLFGFLGFLIPFRKSHTTETSFQVDKDCLILAQANGILKIKSESSNNVVLGLFNKNDLRIATIYAIAPKNFGCASIPPPASKKEIHKLEYFDRENPARFRIEEMNLDIELKMAK